MAFCQNGRHEWFTAGEAAIIADACRVRGMPGTRQGMSKLMARLANDHSSEASFSARKRPGKRGGGGTEYHWLMFPVAMHKELEREIIRRNGGSFPHRPEPSKKFDPAKLPSAFVETQRRAGWTRRVAERELVFSNKLQRKITACWDMAELIGVTPASTVEDDIVLPDWHPAEEYNRYRTWPDLRFTRPSIRTVERCVVKWRASRYFSRDLNSYHQRDVIVIGCLDRPEVIWCWEYDGRAHRNKIDRWDRDLINLTEPWIVGLIGVAERDGNRVPYVPIDFIREAERKRDEGHRRRLEAKRRDQIAKE